MNVPSKVLAWLLLVGIALLPLPAFAQGSPPPLKPEELDQLVAPIALHPDKLLAMILMASTYPLEVVEAARFAKDNKLQGDQLNEALKQYTWDDSVKSLVFFPQVLAMMSEKLDWLQKLGDAFLAQQNDLMASIQRLRARAQATGQLKSTPEQNVVVEPAPAPVPGAAPPAPAAAPPPPPAGAPPAAPPTTVVQAPAPSTTVVQAPAPNVQVVQAPPTVIKIEQTNPQVIAVPSYDPNVVYGAFPPAYPPYYPYPPGYFAAGAMMFAGGMAVGAALWGDCDWDSHGGDVNMNNSNANNFTRNVNNADNARNRVEHRNQGAGAGGRGQWKHDPQHRKGVQYRDAATQQRFNKGGPANAQAREAFRGRTQQPGGGFGQQGGLGQQGARPSQGALGQQGGLSQAAARPSQGAIGQQGGGLGQQPGAGGFGDRGAQASPRSGGLGQGGGGFQGGQAGAFQGMGGGRDAQAFSGRGNASRESFSRSSGGGRGGGGGGRGGGGGGGGGGGRGGGGGGRGGGRR